MRRQKAKSGAAYPFCPGWPFNLSTLLMCWLVFSHCVEIFLDTRFCPSPPWLPLDKALRPFSSPVHLQGPVSEHSSFAVLHFLQVSWPFSGQNMVVFPADKPFSQSLCYIQLLLDGACQKHSGSENSHGQCWTGHLDLCYHDMVQLITFKASQTQTFQTYLCICATMLS